MRIPNNLPIILESFLLKINELYIYVFTTYKSLTSTILDGVF
jgi:hypothetical protein